MTFADILSDCYRRLNYGTSPASEVVTRIKQFIVETQDEILSIPGMQSLLYGSITVASMANQARIGLPPSVSRVLAVRETTNDQTLRARSLGWYRSVDPDPDSNTGTPDYYVPLGLQATARVPASTGTGLWAASTSAADTVPKVMVEGIRVGGYVNTPADKTLNGVTRVAIGTTPLTDYVDVTQFALTAACAGDVTLYDAAAAGNALATIGIGATTSRYAVVALYPTPSAAITYTIDCEHEPFALSANTDEPLLPPRFHRLLALGARKKEYEKTDDSRYDAAARDLQRGIDQLTYYVASPPDLVTVPGGRVDRGSNLGPWFPSGRW
jgi:hypothetical protein